MTAVLLLSIFLLLLDLWHRKFGRPEPKPMNWVGMMLWAIFGTAVLIYAATPT